MEKVARYYQQKVKGSDKIGLSVKKMLGKVPGKIF